MIIADTGMNRGGVLSHHAFEFTANLDQLFLNWTGDKSANPLYDAFASSAHFRTRTGFCGRGEPLWIFYDGMQARLCVLQQELLQDLVDGFSVYVSTVFKHEITQSLGGSDHFVGVKIMNIIVVLNEL